MKHKLITVLLLLVSFTVFAETFSLRDRITVAAGSDIYLSDVVFENVPADRDLCIKSNNYESDRITISRIIECFVNNDIYDITVFGTDCYVCVENNAKDMSFGMRKDMSFDSDSFTCDAVNIPPTRMLNNYLSNYVDNNIDLKISVQKVVPPIELDEVSDYKWELNKIKTSLSDIVNLKRLGIIINDKRYTVFVNVQAYADVYIANKPHYAGECLSQSNWLKKNVDISLYKDCVGIVTDIGKAVNSFLKENVNVGDVLRWSSVNQIPFVYKGESLTAINNQGNIKLSLPCTALKDSYINEKIKVKLYNGNEIVGILNSDKTINF